MKCAHCGVKDWEPIYDYRPGRSGGVCGHFVSGVGYPLGQEWCRFIPTISTATREARWFWQRLRARAVAVRLEA